MLAVLDLKFRQNRKQICYIQFHLTFRKNGKLICKIPWVYFICDLRISLAPLLNPCIYDMIHVATEIKIHWKKVSSLLGEFTLESKCFWKWIIYIYKTLLMGTESGIFWAQWNLKMDKLFVVMTVNGLYAQIWSEIS